MDNDRPIVFTITEIDPINIRIYTKDARVKDGDNDIQICSGNLLKEMIVISSILNDEGYAVSFEVD